MIGPDDRTRALMTAMAEATDEVLNGEAMRANPDYGFVLIAFPFPELTAPEPLCNFISNADRADLLRIITALAKRLEKEAETRPH